MQTFNENYKLLNPEQKQAVDTIEGPVFVMAGPGTGKTQILTLRIANILKEGSGVDPENILALTFTNTAAHNMRERLSDMIGSELAYRVHISTFHSFAEDMMKQHIDFFPEFFKARIASEVERIKILEEILDKQKTHYFSVFKRRPSTMGSLLYSLGKIKDEGYTADEFEKVIHASFDASLKDEDLYYKRAYRGAKAGDIKPGELAKREHTRDKQLELKEIYIAYQEQLRARHLYDFSDLIISFIRGMEQNDDFRSEIQERFQYILVDEHQDTNDAQNRILHLLIDNPVHEGVPNIFVVGDDKQAIYRFAGASRSSFLELQEKVSDIKIIDLVHNYRSGQHVLDSAHGLISVSPDHEETQQLQSFFDDRAGALEYREFSNHKMELLWIAQSIKERLDNGEDPNEIAILYRKNRDAVDLSTVLNLFNIPVCDLSKKNILDDADMLKIFLLFRLVHDLDADDIFARALYINFLNFNVAFVQNVLRRYKNTKYGDRKSLFALLSDEKVLKELGSRVEDVEAARSFVQFLTETKTKSENDDFLEFFNYFIRESGFLAYMLAKKDAVFALAKVEKLYDEVKKESSARENFTFQDFLHYIESLKMYDLKLEIAIPQNVGVQMMTLHGAKGLEFDTVYLVKAMQTSKQGSEITLPFGDFHDGHIEDERRLFYVGLTRAKKNIFITSHVRNAQGKEKARSQFIDIVPGLENISVQDFEKESALSFAKFFDPISEPLRSLVDQAFIEETFFKNKLSVTALNNYYSEPVLYFFRNLLRLPDVKNHFLDFGNLVHETLEYYFKACKDAGKILPMKDVEKALMRASEKNMSYLTHLDRARDIVSAYWTARHDDFALPLELEKSVHAVPFQLSDGREILLTGKIDKITREENGDIVVWDYKTGKAYSDVAKDRKMSVKRQAAFYQLLLSSAYDGKFLPSKVIFDYIEPNKSGEYEQQVFEITQGDLAELSAEIQQLADDVLSGKLLSHTPVRDEKTESYVALLEMIQGDLVQGSLFE